MRRSVLWLRWSGRDLRHRWPVVVALALVIAIGTGAAAALGSMAQWRRMSNDASYAALGMHDLAVSFGEARPESGAALRAVRGIPHARWLRAVEGRLDVPTQVEVPSDGRRVVLSGRLVGVDSSGGGPRVDRVLVNGGRGQVPADPGASPGGSPGDRGASPGGGSPGDSPGDPGGSTGKDDGGSSGSPTPGAGTPGAGGPGRADPGDRTPPAVLEQAFAERYHLPASGTVRLAGGVDVPYAGRGQSPEYLLNGNAAWVGETTRAVLYLPLTAVQRLAGEPGRISSVVLTLRPGADAAVVRAEVADALAAALPGAPATLSSRADDPGYRILYEDIETDQQFWNIVALLMLGGAALATLNLANRVVSAQRRELGVGMALGVPTRTLAIRPLLFGVQVALLGALAGVGVGLLLGWAITGLLDDMLPLPQWRTPFQTGEFLRAAALGVGIPLLGIAYPVLRVVRMQPAEAIRTAHVATGGRAGRRPGWSLSRMPLPGRTLRQLPVRHVLCSPGRAALTATGVGAAICVLVGLLAMLDSFQSAIDRGERELARGVPDRTVVGLDGFYPAGDQRLAAIGALPQVRSAQPGLRLTGTARGHSGPRDGIDLVIDVLDFRTAMWTPTLREPVGAPGGVRGGVPGGIVLAEKAADDLGVRPGDRVRLEHQRQVGPGRFDTVTTALTVSAVHPQPVRTFAYLDSSRAGVFGLAGVANQITVRPADGVGEDDLRAALLGNRAVAVVQPVTAASRATRDMVAQFTDVLTLMEGFVLVLALLIAFNAASVNADERRREHATMLAFGLPPRAVLGNTMVESLIVGLFGTVLGIAGGAAAAGWSVTTLTERTMPDLGLTPSFTAGTVAIALTVGVVAVTLAPLLTARRLRRMEVPAALRVVE